MEFMAELRDMIEKRGVDDVFEQMGMACHDLAADGDEELPEEESRKWRVRGNGVMQALRFYQAFVKERNA